MTLSPRGESLRKKRKTHVSPTQRSEDEYDSSSSSDDKEDLFTEKRSRVKKQDLSEDDNEYNIEATTRGLG